MVLLVGAALLLRSLQKANSADVGFDARDNVLAMSLDLGVQGYTPERAQAFYRTRLDRARELPGVQSVSLAAIVPLSGVMFVAQATPEGREPDA